MRSCLIVKLKRLNKKEMNEIEKLITIRDRQFLKSYSEIVEMNRGENSINIISEKTGI
jgi:hypothetical protein